MDFEQSFSNAFVIVQTKIMGWVESIIAMIPNLFVAVLIVIGFVFMAKFVKWGIKKLFHQDGDLNSNLIGISANIGYFIVLMLGLFVALSVMNLDKTVTSLLAGAGVVGLALGFAFQDSASNIISGIFIAVRKPFNRGDFIETSGYLGTVKKINIRATVMETVHGLEVIMPNKQVFQNPITNYTSTKRRRVDISCRVSYVDDLDKAERLAIEAVRGIKGLAHDLDDPISFIYDSFGESSIDFIIRIWLEESAQGTYLGARSEAIKRIKKAFDENGISVPFPIRTLDFGVQGGEKLNEVLSIEKEDAIHITKTNEETQPHKNGKQLEHKD